MRYTLYKKNISRLLACLLCLMLILTAVPAVRAEEGSCGPNLTWSLSGGTLTISGSGDMDDFQESVWAPWHPYREEIVRLELPQGLTSIGNLAFYECQNITAVSIPDSVIRIGDFAFAHCISIELLSIGVGVAEIGESAFSNCVRISSLRLPAGLKTIGKKAFYRCEIVPTVTIPANVMEIGTSAFGYCKGLVTAILNANISYVPEWLFYGCDMLVSITLPETVSDIGNHAFRGCEVLSSVHYDGTAMTAAQIQEIVNQDSQNFQGGGQVTNATPPDSTTSSAVQSNPDGSYTVGNVTVTEDENVTITTKVDTTYPETDSGTTSNVQVNVTVNTDSGWDKVQETVKDTLSKAEENAATQNGTVNGVDVNIFITGSTQVDTEFLDSLKDKNVNITVTTQDGSSWKVNSSNMTTPEAAPEAKAEEETPVSYDMSYTLAAGTPELSEELGTTVSFLLKFRSAAQINAEVLIQLGPDYAMQNATLFQRESSGLTRRQTVQVDRDGYAHFYLASVDNETDYYIAMYLPVELSEIIVPKDSNVDSENLVDYAPIQYEITGRKSSWGMDIKQVTWIMIGVLGGVVLVVGITMYLLNKRRLRMGYVPDMGEDDDYEYGEE